MSLRILLSALAVISSATAGNVDPKIKHLIILMMENHSFDNMLGWLVRNNSNINGLKGTEYNLVDPQNPASEKIFVTDRGAYRDPDPDHSVEGTALQLFGQNSNIGPIEHNRSAQTMGGFVKSYGTSHANISIMDCMSPEHVPVISTLAMEFAVFDNFFAAVPGPTFPNRVFSMSGTSKGYGANEAGETIEGWPELNMFDVMNATGLDYKVYFTDAATTWLFDTMRTEYALERHHSIDEFAADVAKGDLPALTWIDPGYFLANTDQHPDHDVADGERVMKMVYEALRASPLWDSSALVITYDEHGGFFDHVPPPVEGVPSPDGIPCGDCHVPFNFTRLGVRIPFIVASPWVAKGTVVHEPAPQHQPTPSSQYELVSLVATVAKVFGGNMSLTARDSWAVPFDHVWLESGLTSPRTDCPMTLPVPPAGSPAFAAITADGARPAKRFNHLQRDLTRMVHGMTGAARTPAESDALIAAAGVVDEPTADAHVKGLVRDHFAKRGRTIF